MTTQRDQLIEVIRHWYLHDLGRDDLTQDQENEVLADALLERWCPDHFEPHHYKDPDGERNHFVCHCGRTRESEVKE